MTTADAAKEPLEIGLIVSKAVEVADREGLERLSMRRLAQELGVQAMSLYHHVPNKEALLDEMVDSVFDEISMPRAGGEWRGEMTRRANSARDVLARHRWATPLLDSRENPGTATLGHHEAVLRCLRAGGFSVRLAAHAFSVLDAYIFGFVLQEQALPFETPEEARTVGAAIGAQMGEAYPHMAEMLQQHILTGEYDYGEEFEYGLELILDGVSARLDIEVNAARPGPAVTGEGR